MMTKQEFKLENERKLPFSFGKRHAHEYGNADVRNWSLWLYTMWWMIINSDRVVYSQSRGFFFSLSLPKDKPSRGKSQGELCGRWRRTHSLAFISCNTHLHIFSSAPGIHQLSRSPDKMQQKLHFENKSSYSARGWFLSKSSVCISRLHDKSKGGGGGDAGVSLKEG